MTSIASAAGQRRQRNTMTSRWWLLGASLLIVLSLQPIALAGGDAVPATQRLASVADSIPDSRKVLTLTDVIEQGDDEEEIVVTGQQKEEEAQGGGDGGGSNEAPQEEEVQQGEDEAGGGSDEPPAEDMQQDANEEPQQEEAPQEEEVKQDTQPQEEDIQQDGGGNGGQPQEVQPDESGGGGNQEPQQDEMQPDDNANVFDEQDRGQQAAPSSPVASPPDGNDGGNFPAPTPNDGGGGAPPPGETPPAPTVSPPTEAPPPPDTGAPTQPVNEPGTESPTPVEIPPEPTAAPSVLPPTEAPPLPDTDAPTQALPQTEAPTPVAETPEPTEAPTTPEETLEPTRSPRETLAPTATPETPAPTPKPTEMPTKPPVSAFPTESPIAATTTSPTAAPTTTSDPFIQIEDNVSVVIKPVAGVMSASNAEHFQTTAMAFLSELLIQLEQPIYDVDVSVTGGNVLTRQRRLQSDSMQVDMIVKGRFDPVSGLAETADDYSIGRVSRQFFTVQGDNFVQQLKATDTTEDENYFQAVATVESVTVPEDEATPAGAPGTAPGPAPATDDGPGLAIGGIVAVALVGALVVALGAAFIANSMLKRRKNNPRASSRQAKATSAKKSSTKKSSAKNSNRFSRNKASKQSGSPKTFGRQQKSASSPSSPEQATDEPPPPILSIGGPPSEKGALRRADSDVNSDLQWGAESLVGAESNMSYAYSLEDGIHQSPSVGSLSSYSLTYEKDESSVPREIPNVSSGLSDADDDDDDLDVGMSWTPNASSIIREITAPPGKLGVVLNTSQKGPIVQSVAPGSPLEGMVWPGDVVISIDGMKTSKMSAASLMEYMEKNLFKKRKLTMMSDPDA